MTEIEQLHKILLQMLQEIDSICRKYNITYYSAGGTTIGAIRHRGFIPWDDDADLYMTRDNFYKFREAVKNEELHTGRLDCIDDNPGYPGTIPRLINEESSLIAKYHCMNTCPAGIVIDIFILDPVPSDKELQKEHIGKLNIYADLVMPYYGYTNRADDKFLDMYSEYNKRIETEGRDNIIKELEHDLFSNSEEDSGYYVLRWATVPHIFEKSMFQEPVYFKYEDMELPCPTRWYDYLVQLYGPKWMYVPPHIEDEKHNTIMDTKYKYTNYLIDADRFINKKTAANTYKRRKNLFVEREKLIRPLQEDVLKANGKCILISQEKYLKDNNIDVKQLRADGKFEEIVEAYSIYANSQFSENYIGKMSHKFTHRLNNQVFIPLNDFELEILIEAFYMTGAVKRAVDLIRLREENGELSDNIKSLKSKLENIYSLYKSFYSCDYEETKKILELFDNTETVKISDVFKIKLQTDIFFGAGREEIISIIDEYGNNEDAEILKIKGDIYFRDGDLSIAKDFYGKAMPNLTNGMMLLDIQDKFCDLKLNFETPINIFERTILQDKQFELLCEIDDICKQNNIEYYLAGSTLIYGYYKHVFGNEYKTNTLIMKPEDAVKFIDYCEKQLPEDRTIDYSINNEFHNGHTIYYCDKNTLSMDWRRIEESKKVGIHITIYILKKKDAHKIRWVTTRALDILQTSYVRVLNNRYKKKAKYSRFMIKLLVNIIGRERIENTVYKNYIAAGMDNPNERYYLSKNNYRRSIGKYYKKEYFEGNNTTEIYGKEFPIPAHIDEYIDDIHGKYVEDSIKIRKHVSPLFKLIDCNMTFEDIKSVVDENIIDPDNYITYKKGVAMNPEIKKLNKRVRGYWNILLRSEDRFKLYLQYEPLKEEILKLHNDQNYEQIEKILEDYDKAVRKNLKRHLGLMFDQEIFDVYCDLLVRNGEENMCSKLINLIPEKHKEKIIIE